MADACINGHDIRREDAVYHINGERRCKVCARATIQRSRARNAALRSHPEDLVTAREVENFEKKVDRSGRCHLWTGAINNGGYPLFAVAGRQKLAHRVAYRMYKGPIEEGLVVDHLCETPRCVNPEHLEAVTQLVNMRRYHYGREEISA